MYFLVKNSYLQEKSAQKFEKFFAKLNDSIGMEFKTSKKMDVIKRFYEKYNDISQELEFYEYKGKEVIMSPRRLNVNGENSE